MERHENKKVSAERLIRLWRKLKNETKQSTATKKYQEKSWYFFVCDIIYL